MPLDFDMALVTTFWILGLGRESFIACAFFLHWLKLRSLSIPHPGLFQLLATLCFAVCELTWIWQNWFIHG